MESSLMGSKRSVAFGVSSLDVEYEPRVSAFELVLEIEPRLLGSGVKRRQGNLEISCYTSDSPSSIIHLANLAIALSRMIQN